MKEINSREQSQSTRAYLNQSRTMSTNQLVNRIVAVLFVVAAITANASAYIDAGTGSIVTQVLIAGALGAVLTFKSFWQALRRFVAKGLHR